MDFFPVGIEILFLETEADLKSAFLLELFLEGKNHFLLVLHCQALLPSENFSPKGRGGVEMA